MRIKLLDRGRREQGAHQPGLFGFVSGLARDLGLWATGRLHGCAGRALLGLWAGNDGAARAGARRAGPNLAGLVARADAGRAGRNRGLQNVSRHVRRRRALGLEHVATEIGLRGARRNRRLEHILGPINLRTAVAVLLITTVLLV